MPDYALVKLKSRAVINLPAFSLSGNRLTASTIIRGNDLYDTYVRNAPPRNQPTGFDQWMAMYDQFLVHQSALKVTPINFTTDDSGGVSEMFPFRLVVIPIDGTTINLSTSDPLEMAYVKSKVYNGSSFPTTDSTSNLIVTVPDSGSTLVRGVFNRMSTKKMTGYKDLADVEQLRGTSTASPTKGWGWLVYIESLNTYSSALTYSQTMLIECMFYAKTQFFSRNSQIPDST